MPASLFLSIFRQVAGVSQSVDAGPGLGRGGLGSLEGGRGGETVDSSIRAENQGRRGAKR